MAERTTVELKEVGYTDMHGTIWRDEEGNVWFLVSVNDFIRRTPR